MARDRIDPSSESADKIDDTVRSRLPVAETIGSEILIVRRQKVLLDSTLATLYGVATKVCCKR